MTTVDQLLEEAAAHLVEIPTWCLNSVQLRHLMEAAACIDRARRDLRTLDAIDGDVAKLPVSVQVEARAIAYRGVLGAAGVR